MSLHAMLDAVSQAREFRWLTALRRGFLLLLPLVMVGGLSLFLLHLPIPAFHDGMQALLGPTWQTSLNAIYQASYGMLGLCLALSTGYALAALESPRQRDLVQPVATASIGLICYLLFAQRGSADLGADIFNVHGVLPAALCSLIGAETFLRLARIKRLQVHLPGEADALVSGMLGCILPAMLTVGAFAAGLALLEPWLPDGDLGRHLILQLFSQVDSELGRALLFNLLSQSLWFLGAHGNNLLEAANTLLFQPATADNTLAAAFGQAPAFIVTKTFFDAFIFLGGSGATGGLLIAMLIAGRRKNTRRIGVLAAPASLININEPLVYGLPIVLNPWFLLPFIGLPLLLTLTTWLALRSGLVPLVTQPVEWTTPIFINAWLATHSFRGVALQCFNLALSVAVYLPFLRLAELRHERANEKAMRGLLDEMQVMFQNAPQSIVPRQDAVGQLARELLSELPQHLANGAIHLVYQPRVDEHGRVLGVEALLRWRHPEIGAIPPTTLVGLAEETGRMRELGDWIIEQACAQLAAWRSNGLTQLQMAVNLSPLQLSDPQLVPHVQACLTRWNIPPDMLELEITETRRVGNDEQTNTSMKALNDLGVRLAMDDFGMGYSSLLYMRRFRIDTIKLDGSLTREAEQNASCQDIIAYVALLCRSRGASLVAEYIETPEQLSTLRDLGCQEFQGYLFSPPLPPVVCYAFILQHLEPPSTLDAHSHHGQRHTMH